MKETFWMVIAAIALVGILFLISSRTRPPAIPSDGQHRGIVTDAACRSCHAPGLQAPLKPAHPPKQECLICHRPAR